MSKKQLAVFSVAAAAGITGLILLVSAFTTTSAEAKSNLCSSLSNLSATVTSYESLNPATATQSDVDAAADDIANAWDDVVNDADDWVNAYDNSLTNWYYDLDYAIDNLDSGNTVRENLEEIQPVLADFPDAFAETFDGSGC